MLSTTRSDSLSTSQSTSLPTAQSKGAAAGLLALRMDVDEVKGSVLSPVNKDTIRNATSLGARLPRETGSHAAFWVEDPVLSNSNQKILESIVKDQTLNNPDDPTLQHLQPSFSSLAAKPGLQGDAHLVAQQLNQGVAVSAGIATRQSLSQLTFDNVAAESALAITAKYKTWTAGCTDDLPHTSVTNHCAGRLAASVELTASMASDQRIASHAGIWVDMSNQPVFTVSKGKLDGGTATVCTAAPQTQDVMCAVRVNRADTDSSHGSGTPSLARMVDGMRKTCLAQAFAHASAPGAQPGAAKELASSVPFVLAGGIVSISNGNQSGQARVTFASPSLAALARDTRGLRFSTPAAPGSQSFDISLIPISKQDKSNAIELFVPRAVAAALPRGSSALLLLNEIDSRARKPGAPQGVSLLSAHGGPETSASNLTAGTASDYILFEHASSLGSNKHPSKNTISERATVFLKDPEDCVRLMQKLSSGKNPIIMPDCPIPIEADGSHGSTVGSGLRVGRAANELKPEQRLAQLLSGLAFSASVCLSMAGTPVKGRLILDKLTSAGAAEKAAVAQVAKQLSDLVASTGFTRSVVDGLTSDLELLALLESDEAHAQTTSSVIALTPEQLHITNKLSTAIGKMSEPTAGSKTAPFATATATYAATASMPRAPAAPPAASAAKQAPTAERAHLGHPLSVRNNAPAASTASVTKSQDRQNAGQLGARPAGLRTPSDKHRSTRQRYE